ncbi:Satratoxin biosynthesis SC1 cluster protein 4 [Colletotrichum sidae]|uniref:Satratoxin biosynthesis SC1 cluster protein 4 n=1 Tax=Colletotrichum sidae TaxID=1347389 RepID=A0A4R8TAE8_9PEZI|nr:Satratoxin biosynthesis SC1 cluster protein 4 [Colletotrichum sidae]
MILRITTKFSRISTWGWDDYTIIAAYAILVGFFGMHFFLEANGAGRDLWTLNEDQITNFFKGFYAFQTLYHSCIDIIKASILFMYLRIFHLPDEKIRIVLWITQGVNLANGLIFIFLGLFQCTPVSLVWTFWTGEATGKCLPIAKLGLAHVCINIGLDVWMLILPATQIFRMNMAKRKKFAVMFMFGLGLFLTIVSIIRIPAILEFSKQPLNPTVAMMPSVIWSDIELYVGIFTACIPNMRQFFVSFVLRKSEKQKRLSEAKSGGSRGSNFTPKTPTLTRQLSDLDNADESHHGSP